MPPVRCLVRDVGSAVCVSGDEPISGSGGSHALVDDRSGNPVELFQPR